MSPAREISADQLIVDRRRHRQPGIIVRYREHRGLAVRQSIDRDRDRRRQRRRAVAKRAEVGRQIEQVQRIVASLRDELAIGPERDTQDGRRVGRPLQHGSESREAEDRHGAICGPARPSAGRSD